MLVPSEFNKVLRPREPKKPLLSANAFGVGRVSLVASLLLLTAASIWTALAPGNFGSASTEANIDPEVLKSVRLDNDPPPIQNNSSTAQGQYAPQLGTSGANVRRTQFADGSEVNIYSPNDRQSSGAVLLNAQRFGQDPMVAARPNDALIEQTEFGPLPQIGADGLRPMEQYARPWSGARGTRIAIVVGGIGLSQTGSQSAIAQLPSEVTLGFAASGNSLQRWMQEARRQGHEILLQMPMQAFGEAGGEGKLLANAVPEANLQLLRRSMASITNYTGVMNHLGGQFLSNEAALIPVMQEIAGRGLLFLDDGTSAQSRAGEIARQSGYPVAFGDMLLDSEVEEMAILRKLDDLERLARRNGTAIGVGSAFDETVSAVAKWVSEAQSRGIEIVGVASLVSDRQ